MKSKLTRKGQTKVETVIIILLLVAIILSGGSMFHLSKNLENLSRSVSSVSETQDDILRIIGAPTPTPTKPPVEIVVLLHNEGYIGKKTVEDLKAYAATQNINIKWINTDLVGKQERIALSIASGTHEYDIVGVWCTTKDYYDAGYLAPLDEFIIRDFGSVKALEDRYIKDALGSKMPDGKIYSLPFWCELEVLHYRTDLFDQYDIRKPTIEQPMTWDEVIKAAEKLTLDINGDGVVDIYGMNEMWDDDNFWSVYVGIVHAYGGEVFKDYPHAPKAAFNSPAGIEALNVMKTLWQNGWVHPESITQGSGGSGCRTFYAGLGAMSINYMFCGAIANDPEKSQIVDKFAVAPLPGAVNPYGGTGMMEAAAITLTSPHKEEAWKILKYLTINETRAANMYADNGLYPVVKDALTHPTVVKALEEKPILKQIDESIAAMTQYPYTLIAPEHFVEIYKAWVPFAHKALIGELTVEEALSQAEAKANEILAG